MIDHRSFHSLQENLKLLLSWSRVVDFHSFPFLTGKFEAMCGGTPYAKYYKFPFLTGKFEAQQKNSRQEQGHCFHSLQENLKPGKEGAE